MRDILVVHCIALGLVILRQSGTEFRDRGCEDPFHSVFLEINILTQSPFAISLFKEFYQKSESVFPLRI